MIADMNKVVLRAFRSSTGHNLPLDAAPMKFPPR